MISAAKVVDGYTDGSFNPQATLTRGAAAKIICNLILGPTTASALSANVAPYKDVAANHTFAGYIAYCQQQGIISGYADGTFRPAASLTGYAFMKMLLGALGYDAQVEGYVGNNWSIAVAKRALNIGLDDGLKGNFVGTKPVTREEAALYAFNTLTADMVEYDTTIQIGDVTVAGSKAEIVAQGSYKNTMNKAGLQFAEKYFQDLKMNVGSDDFARPATTWNVKTSKVGTYTDTPDATYVGKVELGTIYNDLGMGTKDSAEYYIDGAEQNNVDVKKGSDVEVGTGNGSQVEVFIDSQSNDVTICVINTWVGTVNKSVEATSSKDAYIVIDEAEKAPANFKAEYETDEKFEDDAVVLYTYSETARAIKSVEVAESQEGTLTKTVNTKGLTLDETDYKYSANYSFEHGLSEKTLTMKSDYVVYLDNAGNVIYVEEVEFVSNDYALVLAIEGEQGSGFKTNRAKVVFADGAVKTIELDKNYKKAGIAVGDVVTWKVDDDTKEYTLKETKDANNSADNKSFLLTKGEAKIKVSTDKHIFANSKTVFVVKNHSGDWDVYTGIKNVPSIDAKGNQVPAFYFCKTADMATIMFIDASADGVSITSSSKDVIFLAGESASKLTTDKDGNEYREYNAVVNGEITTVKVLSGTKLAVEGVTSIKTGITDGVKNYLYGSAEYTDGMISGLTKHDDGRSAVKTEKLSGEYTIALGNRAYTVDEKAMIFKIDEDGNITESTLKNIKNDDNDAVLAVYDDGALTYIFVQEVPAGKTPDEEGSVEGALELTNLYYNKDSKEYGVQGNVLKGYKGAVEATIEITTVSGAKVVKGTDTVIASEQEKGATIDFTVAGVEKRADEYNVVVKVLDKDGKVLASAEALMAI